MNEDKKHFSRTLKALSSIGSTADNETILRAIRDQRWFFFENNDKILFDGKTALVWANLKYFRFSKNVDGDIERYSRYDSYSEVRNLITRTNAENFGGFSDWKIPSPFELWDLVKDETFPFHGGSYRRILGQDYWCVDHDRKLSVKDLDSEGVLSSIQSGRNCCVIPCTAALKPKDFRESAQEIFDIFTKNNLVPIFDDANITELYRKFLVDKAPGKLEIKLAAGFDFKPILTNYNADELVASPIKYFDAVNEVADTLLEALQTYETAQAATIGELSQTAIKLGEDYTDNPSLTDDENFMLADRQKFLARRLELGTNEVKEQLLALKAQAEKFFARLDEINDGNNSIRELAALEVEPRANFVLVVENYSRLVQNTQDRLNFFIQNKDFVLQIVGAWENWSNDYKIFKTGLREELLNSCRTSEVDEEIYSAWYEDWRAKRFEIEQKFLPIVKFALKGNLFESLENTLNVLREYRNSLDEFYLHKRKDLYIRNFVKSGGSLPDKFEKDSELCILTEKFMRNLQKVIFSCEKVEERLFLLKWSESLLNMPVDAIISIIRERELGGMFEEILMKFTAVKLKNFAAYIADARAFAEASKQRDDEINRLIFQMKKGLKRK